MPESIPPPFPTTFPVGIASIPPPGTYITFYSVIGDLALHYIEKGVPEALAPYIPSSIPLVDERGATANVNLYFSPSNQTIWWNFTSTSTSVSQIPDSITGVKVATTPLDLPVSNLSPATSTDSSLSASSTSAAQTPKQSIPISSGDASTTATTATNTLVAPVAHKAPGGISGGKVAGVAVGCLLAGALIAGLLGWFFIGRSKKKGSRHDHEGTTLAFLPGEKGVSSKIHSVESGSPVSQLGESDLPQPLEDDAISGDMSKLSILVKNHVQSFYHTGRVNPGLLDLEDLQALGKDLPLSTGTLSTLIGNPNTREIALRFCVAWVLISRMQPKSSLDITFLPPEITRCFQALSPHGGHRNHAALAAKWRSITTELMRSTYASNPITESDPRFPNIRAAAEILDGILRHYMDSRLNHDERRRNLEEICKRAAGFAFTLFSQPSTWIFDWKEDEGVKSGCLCIFPALVQVTDESGHRLTVPRPFSEAVARELNA